MKSMAGKQECNHEHCKNQNCHHCDHGKCMEAHCKNCEHGKCAMCNPKKDK